MSTNTPDDPLPNGDATHVAAEYAEVTNAPPAKKTPEKGVRRIRGGRVAVAAAAVGVVAFLALGYGLTPPAQADRKPTEVKIDLRKTNGELPSPAGLALPVGYGYEQATVDQPPPTAGMPTYASATAAPPPTSSAPASPSADTPTNPAAAEVLAKLREQNEQMTARLAEYERRLGDELAEAKRQQEQRQAALDAPIGFATVKPDEPQDADALAATSPALASASDIGGPLNPLVVTPGGGGELNPNEVQPEATRSNLQTEKIAFLNAAEQELGTYLRTGPTGPVLPQFELAAGSVIPGFTVTGINTDLPGKLVGRVSSDVYDSATGRYVLIPQGSVAVGSYSSLVSNGQNRVLIAWEMLTFPDGRSVELLRQPGVDAAGYAGLADHVDYHWPQLFLAGGLSTAVAIGGELAEGDNSGFGQTEDVAEQLRELVAGGASDTTSRIANKVIDRQLDVQPTITVRPGWRFNILVTRNLVLEPYVDSRR